MFRKFSLLALLLLSATSLVAVACGDDDDDDTSGDSTATTAASSTAAGESTAAGSPSAAATDPNAYARPELLLETDQLEAALTGKDLVIVDLRKKESYDAGHIPGAVWYDPAALKSAANPLYVIDEETFATKAGELGIDSTKKVVAYDDGNGLLATRFWWVLWYYGQEGSVLNGGWAKWEKDGLAATKDVPAVTKVAFTPKANEDVICALDYVEQKSEDKDPNVVILDVRSPGEYSGADVRSAKGGHVPNAVNLDWTLSMTTSQPMVWKPASELRAQFAKAGITEGMEVITYCQTGVRAAHSLFTLRLMGFDGVRNFDGSWAEYGNDKETAVER